MSHSYWSGGCGVAFFKGCGWGWVGDGYMSIPLYEGGFLFPIHFLGHYCPKNRKKHLLDDFYLHSCLHYINWSVSEHTSSTSNTTNDKCPYRTNILLRVPFLEPGLEVGVDKESYHLICSLFDHSGSYTFINTRKPWRKILKLLGLSKCSRYYTRFFHKVKKWLVK